MCRASEIEIVGQPLCYILWLLDMLQIWRLTKAFWIVGIQCWDKHGKCHEKCLMSIMSTLNKHRQMWMVWFGEQLAMTLEWAWMFFLIWRIRFQSKVWPLSRILDYLRTRCAICRRHRSHSLCFKKMGQSSCLPNLCPKVWDVNVNAQYIMGPWMPVVHTT